VLTEEQRTHRLAGEHDLPGTLVGQRRQAEHDRRVAAAQAALDAAQQAVDAVLSRRAQLEARRQNRAEIARSRVLRYGDFIRRQAAIYRGALARRHPDHEALVHRWRDDLFPPPAWAGTDTLVPSSREAGVAA
jgi:multidrug efflux pump subunit AcrA (membrane-fusion protein)